MDAESQLLARDSSVAELSANPLIVVSGIEATTLRQIEQLIAPNQEEGSAKLEFLSSPIREKDMGVPSP